MTDTPWIRPTQDGAELDVVVVPRASRTELAGVLDRRVRVRLAAPPVEGKANATLVAFFAKLLGVKRSSVSLVSGQRGRRKTIRIRGIEPSEVRSDVLKEIGDTD